MKIIELHNEKKAPELTVAMPIFNGGKIGWLSIESLINQKDITFDWELIIYEEEQENILGVEWFKSHIERLAKNRCVRIAYITNETWVHLSEKWKRIAQNMSDTSKSFLLQAVDDYSQPLRLAQTYEYINKKGVDWLDYRYGLFYNINNGQSILYTGAYKTNLDMGVKAKHTKLFSITDKPKGIDGHLLKCACSNAHHFRKHTIQRWNKGGLYTDGYNNISKKRVNFYDRTTAPFQRTDVTPETNDMPDYIVEKLKQLTHGAN